ncbi:carbohydrate-binding protein [Streptomyces sp. NBC_01007]|nr:carbohydrate-binding protein [Streptomyces sp. NBC_01007]
MRAEDCDTGGQGVACNVTSVNGDANSYRADGVDLDNTSDTGGGHDVGWTNGGQRFRCTVDVATAGTCTLDLRVAAPSAAAGALHLSDASGIDLTGAVDLPAAGDWQTWADLGSARSASRVVLRLPGTWGARTRTLTLGGSADGTTFTVLKSPAAHTFDPGTKNTVTLTFPTATQRHFRVTITADSGRPAGQVPEFQIWTSGPRPPRCRRTPRPVAPPCAGSGAGCSLKA